MPSLEVSIVCFLQVLKYIDFECDKLEAGRYSKSEVIHCISEKLVHPGSLTKGNIHQYVYTPNATSFNHVSNHTLFRRQSLKYLLLIVTC